MLDSRLKFLQSRAEDGPAELVGLEATGRFALTTEGVRTPRVRVLVRMAEGHGADDLAELSQHMGLTVHIRAGDVVGGEIGIDRLTELDESEAVSYVEASRPTLTELDAAVPETHADKVHTGPPGLRGAGVIVGVVDSGIDWRHGCFRDPTGKTRILRIWDQNLTPEAGEASPAPFGHGVEYQRSAIDDALSSPNPLGMVRHMDDSVGHGTHVAGIAAGDGSSAGNGQPEFTFVGVAPEAELVVVANRVTTEALGDSMGTLEAVGYVFKVAETLGRPAVVNISQGDNLGPHDGSSLLERGIDNLLDTPGRALVKSAGNAANAGVHATGQVTEGDSDVVSFLVPVGDDTPDTLDIWYSGADRISLRITPPNGTASVEIDPGTTSTEVDLSGGNKAFVDSVVHHSLNGDNRIYVQLSPGSQTAIRPGTWSLTLIGQTVADSGRWHAWMERGRTVPQFIGAHRNDETTISVPGTSRKVVTAASYITKGAGQGNLSTFSSRGPTRDGRHAPTLAAPGQAITSALVGAAGSSQYQPMSGTSMAAPHLTGVCALMFQSSPTLTQDDLVLLLTSSARLDPFTGGAPGDDWGAGKVDAAAAVDAIP
ncbi:MULTISPECIES: S8 family peptidase [Streptomyces]|uniref:S8 family peptidase n=2 Tax=Streptomyces TaxID=1883 RepID=A0ABU4N3S9_9ACTN|nr:MULTISPECIES: S8 family peptidase [Streptomyces]MBE4741191.1 S8 family peptidase [Streptomyces caniscabiei]MBE4760842.1 S8 family peptidase [Streptomyces caniscabiei]MBE4774825.1 S8 family peptidase [Streptomyces caniscabiei]MBE4789584.1 S8 family peptidase [Streptomyces caniscabiei]MBE4798747.1 S8 family peptidase [Streptomyces caniscabiei]